jgi:hypothetical protein
VIQLTTLPPPCRLRRRHRECRTNAQQQPRPAFDGRLSSLVASEELKGDGIISPPLGQMQLHDRLGAAEMWHKLPCSTSIPEYEVSHPALAEAEKALRWSL